MEFGARRKWMTLGFLALSSCWGSSVSSAQVLLNQGPADFEDLTLRAMFSHGLNQSALAYVRGRASLEKNRSLVAWWATREMECHARWALQDAAGAEKHWQACDAIAVEYQSKLLDGITPQTDARWPWLEWQLGRCRLMKTQNMLASYLAAPTNQALREQALEMVREIRKRMEELSKELKRRQVLGSRQGTVDATEASVEQLRALDADAQMLMCEALMVRWQLYPVGSEDRAAALSEVKTMATDFLRSRSDASGRASLQLAQAIAELESGDPAAMNTLERLASQPDHAQVRVLAASHVAKALAQQGQESRARAALAVVEQVAGTDPSLAPLVGLAKIEVSLATLEKTPAAQREKEMAQLVQLAQSMGPAYGDYWRTRAESLLVGKMSSSSVNDSKLGMDLLLAEVRQLIAKTDQDSYRQAAKKLVAGRDTQSEGGHGEQAIDLAVKAAAIYRELKDWDQAVDVIEQMAVKFARLTPAPEAHLAAVEAQVEKLKLSIQDENVRARYVSLLKQQMKLWPESEATEKAKSWLYDWCIGQNQAKVYVEALRDAIDHCEDADLRDRYLLDFCEQTLLLPMQDRWSVVADLFDPSTTVTPQSDASSNSKLKQAGLALVILSDLGSSSFIRPDSDRNKNWQEFQTLQQKASAGSLGVFFECVSELAKIQLNLPLKESSNWNQLSDLSRAVFAAPIVDAIDSLEANQRASVLAKLSLSAGWAKIESKRLSPVARASLERILFWAGDKSVAERLASLAKENQRDGQVQLTYCYFLRSTNETDAAKKIATGIAGLSQTGSATQLAARWILMRMQIESGEQAEAIKSAKFMLATQPAMSPMWVSRFKQIAEMK